MKAIFLYKISGNIIDKIRDKSEGSKIGPSYYWVITESEQNKDEYLTFIFMGALGTGIEQETAEGIKQVNSVLRHFIGEDEKYDFIGLGIHGGDWGISTGSITRDVFFPDDFNDSKYAANKKDTLEFLKKIVHDFYPKDGYAKIKLFTHTPGHSDIYEQAKVDIDKFFTLKFQKQIFLVTIENFETLLHRFRVIVSALDAGSVKEEILSSEDVDNLKNGIVAIFEGDDKRPGFRDYLEDDPEKMLYGGMFDKIKAASYAVEEFIAICKDIEEKMTEVLIRKKSKTIGTEYHNEIGR